MAMIPLLALLVAPAFAAMTPEERALILNEEMDFLLKAAPQARVWSRPDNIPSTTPRSGPAPSQVPGVENLEDRFFSDEVSFQAAASTDPAAQEEDAQERPAAKRVDGTLPYPHEF